jgi:hypothetical protein
VGQTANAPKGTVVETSEIWVSDPDNPGAKLVRARLGQVPVREEPSNPAAGITVVVGDGFGELRQGPASVILKDDTVVCSPGVS